VEINPDLPEIYLALGQYYYHGFLDYDKALYEFDKGLEIKPNYEEVLRFIGGVKRRQGKFEESIINLKKSLVLDPLNESINFEIGNTFFLIKNYEMAEKYLDEAISTVPDLGWPYVFKAKVYIYRYGNVNKAYQILKSSLDVVLREKWMVVSLLAQVQILGGRYEEALKTLSDESSEVFEGQYRCMPKSQLLATIYGLQKNKHLEKTHYDSAQILIDSKLIELPDDANLHSALGLVLAGLGKKEEALKEGKLAVELLPIKKEAWIGWHRELDLAKIYTMVGEYDLAIEKIDYLLSIPGELSVPYIKIDPVWQDLLELPRMKEVISKYE
jgi:tetratricopeptide (TPR) repeat protein